MPILSREMKFAWSKGPQADIDTLAAAANLVSLRLVNTQPVNPNYVGETDAGFMGAGDEFARTFYPSHVLLEYEAEFHLTSQVMALAAVFGLGVSVKSLTGPWLYTCTPIIPASSGVIELPYLSLVQQLRDIDEGYIGCVVNGFRVVLGKGPGLEQSKIFVNFLGTGNLDDSTGYTLPALTIGNRLSQGGTQATINGVDYVLGKTLESLTWGWNNDIPTDQGYYVGSGEDADGFALQGRLEFRNRKPLLEFVVRVEPGSTELAKLKAHTTGTAVITQGSGDHTYTATFHQVAFQVVERQDSDGILTVAVTASPESHTSNGVLTVAAKTDIDAIGE